MSSSPVAIAADRLGDAFEKLDALNLSPLTSEEVQAEIDAARATRYTPKIAKNQLVHGQYYTGRCRNASVARWNEERQCFFHWRSKFGERFIEEIRAPEDDQCFDVFVVDAVTEPTEEIPFKD